MADDDSLRILADRIQARAVRRMGELLKQFDGRGDHMKKDGTVLSLTQKQTADEAGVSERQRKTAVAIANVPAEKFESAIEAPKPATVTQLAEMGKQVRTVPPERCGARFQTFRFATSPRSRQRCDLCFWADWIEPNRRAIYLFGPACPVPKP
jgi:hypothetical protein